MIEARAEPLHSLTFIEVRSDSIERASALLREYAQALRQGSTPVDVQLLQQIERPEHFALLESADRPEPITGRERSAQPTLQSASSLFTAPLDRRTHHGFGPSCRHPAGAASSESPDGGHPIYAITHLDIAGPVRPAVQAALERLATEACRTAGNERFEIWQQIERGNHFNLIALWRSRADLEAFAASVAARDFRGTVGPRLGALYDERLYRVVPGTG